MADGEITDDQRLSGYADWIRANKDKAGTPEFVKVTDAYRTLRAPQLQGAGGDVGSGGVGDAGDTADNSGDSNAGGIYSTVGRVASNAVAPMVDIAGRGVNVLANAAEKSGFSQPTEETTLSSPYSWSWIGNKLGLVKPEDVEPVTRTFTGQVPSLGAGIRSMTGVEEMPQDAGVVRQALEGLSSAALSGGGAISAFKAAPTVASGVAAGAKTLASNARGAIIPYAGSVAGEKLGGYAGEAVGGETGRGIGEYLGGLAGGVGANTVARPPIERGVQAYYANRYGRPDVGEVVRQAQEEGVTPTFGMLANRKGAHLEQSLADTPGVENARLRAADQIRTAVDNMATRREAIPPSTPGNADVVSIANQMRGVGQPAGPAVEQVLLNRVGKSTPTDAQSIYDRWEALRNDNASGAGSLTSRLSPMFESIPRDAQGNPNVPLPPPARYLPPAGPPAAVSAAQAPPAPAPAPAPLPSNVVQLRPQAPQPPPAAAPPSAPTTIKPNVQVPPAAYSQVAGARTRLGQDLPGAESVPGGMKRNMYGGMTDVMREAAASRGVPGEAFDTTHRIYANEQTAAALRDKIATTVGQEKAPAMRQFADYVDALKRDPKELTHVTGSDQPGTIQDISRSLENLGGLARQHNIPTEQGGMARNIADVLRRHTPRHLRFLLTELQHGQGRLLESDLVRSGLAGERASMAPRGMSASELATVLNVINQRQYRQPEQ